jgi:Trypsin-co-occurring domain 2
MMDLKAFVAETLQQICDGIRQAQSKEGGDAINAESNLGVVSGHLIPSGSYGVFTRVDFDIAVSAESVGGAKGGIKVWGIGDIEGGGERKTGHANRIAFSVPVRLPDGAKSIQGSRHRVMHQGEGDRVWRGPLNTSAERR